MKDYGYIRVASAVPSVNVADTGYNASAILRALEEACEQGAGLLVLPELCLTGYTCADLFMQETLLDAAEEALRDIASCCDCDTALILGMPVRHAGALYNCAVAISRGRILGVVPKTFLPNYGEFYEKRWFAPASSVPPGTYTVLAGQSVPFGTDLLFKIGNATVGIEICEDLWTPLPPSTMAAMGGAQIIANLSASNELTGKHDYLSELIRNQSGRLHSAYIYASAGFGESTTDVVYGGKTIIAENGTILRQSARFMTEPQIEVADIDLQLLEHDRRRNGSFTDSARLAHHSPFRIIECGIADNIPGQKLMRPVDPDPFVPASAANRNERCDEIINIQTAGLMRRLHATNCKSLVVGVSGGLDSTLALLIAVKAFRQLNIDTQGVLGVTMPGFGTTDRTYNNAITLIKQLGASLKEINIAKAVRQHFEDIGHDENVRDITYENSQARERTQILMDLANKTGGMVLGTGDLSELALGWCTYNGDQRSMYGVNASVPKTLVKHLVQWFADNTEDPALHDALCDVIDTPISPELIPASSQGEIRQKTEDLVGPYRLHDFFIYNMIRHGFHPRKIYMLACNAFAGVYDNDTIKHWLKTFCRRLFNQQFKRSCMPDGPKVGSISLSPRGDWRMPSDASSTLWIKECEDL